MSRNQRIALVVAVVAVAVVAFAIAQPGDDDNGSDTDTAAQTTTQTTGTDRTAEGSSPTATATVPEPAPAPERPEVHRIVFENGAVRGGPPTIEATTGDTVRIVVTSDVPETVHLHGYDIERQVAPGKPARLVFKADLEGQFEFETHDTDLELASVVVEPS